MQCDSKMRSGMEFALVRRICGMQRAVGGLVIVPHWGAARAASPHRLERNKSMRYENMAVS